MKLISERARIYDCFIYDGEDCLDLRLKSHWSKVDWFVMAEANMTHSGLAKEYMFDPLRYEWAKSKIRYIQLDKGDFDGCQTPRDRERRQREALLDGIADANPQDTVIVSDVDEILRPDVIGRVDEGAVVIYEQLMMYFYADYLCVSEPFWQRACSVTAAFAKSHSIDDIRTQKAFVGLKRVVIPDAGWHFSYLGGPRVATQKVERFIHQEFNKDKYKDVDINYKRMIEGKDVYRRSRRWGRVANYHLGSAIVSDWFVGKSEYRSPLQVRFYGDVRDVVAAYKSRLNLTKKIQKLYLGMWNKF
jgi:beta-1,4-mannosyl-glycoprotein beta-1,4-N-acetylglucosaminyltransferase